MVAELVVTVTHFLSRKLETLRNLISQGKTRQKERKREIKKEKKKHTHTETRLTSFKHGLSAVKYKTTKII